mmetsp:Transcript_162584/g.521224  ORF Transcript_162584/g.521224 Transcript_162584/m.521224 type:complete len:234 (-) Transcript_162584:293-994(-)
MASARLLRNAGRCAGRGISGGRLPEPFGRRGHQRAPDQVGLGGHAPAGRGRAPAALCSALRRAARGGGRRDALHTLVWLAVLAPVAGRGRGLAPARVDRGDAERPGVRTRHLPVCAVRGATRPTFGAKACRRSPVASDFPGGRQTWTHSGADCGLPGQAWLLSARRGRQARAVHHAQVCQHDLWSHLRAGLRRRRPRYAEGHGLDAAARQETWLAHADEWALLPGSAGAGTAC